MSTLCQKRLIYVPKDIVETCRVETCRINYLGIVHNESKKKMGDFILSWGHEYEGMLTLLTNKEW